MAELITTGMSYTNKDFQSIYAQELDSVKLLTKKWDPSSSNEADPGVVLLKENAIVADSENYNSDKNVLELFPDTVTQVGNARRIFSSLGYNMKWYQSAKTSVYVKYRKSLEPDKLESISIPKFTAFTDDDNSVSYVSIQDATISPENLSVFIPCVEGTLHDYEINGDTDITLENLDSENRLYFTQRNVAENGIFVYSISEEGVNADQWVQVDNVEAQSPASYCYSFGVLPNTDTCYIEFPDDIVNLIGSGLNIKYITSSGISGNIKAQAITKLLNDTALTKYSEGNTEEVQAEDLIISNQASTANGKDPETIDEARKAYKRVLGTFDTLITCRDYSNKIYDLETSGGYAVSNIQVSDRTNDLVHTTNVVTLTEDGNKVNHYLENPFLLSASSRKDMTAYDIKLTGTTYQPNIYDTASYNESFTPISGNDEAVVRELIEEQKSIQHDYTEDYYPFYMLKNFCSLKGKILTYQKVTAYDKKDIEDNVKVALYKKFEARNVSFGEPLEYDEIVETITSADTRIKSVILDLPVYTIRGITRDDADGSINSTNSFSLDDEYNYTESIKVSYSSTLLARMILNGNVPLYSFNLDFDYDFGQTDIEVLPSNSDSQIASITSGVVIPADSLKNTYKLKANENVLIYQPSLLPDTTYQAFLYVQVHFNTVGRTIENEQSYTLGKEETIKFYKQKSETQPFVTLTEGTIITPNTTSSDTTAWLKNGTIALGSDKSITSQKINSVNLTGQELKCFWETRRKDSDGNYILFDVREEFIILQEGETFVYQINNGNGFATLGQGTYIHRTAASSDATASEETKYPKISANKKIDTNWINGVGEINQDSDNWYTYNLNTLTLTITELSIIKLSEGDTIKTTNIEKDFVTETFEKASKYYDFVEGDTLTYTYSDGTAGATLSYDTTMWKKVTTMLNLDCYKSTPQIFLENQYLRLYDDKENLLKTDPVQQIAVGKTQAGAPVLEEVSFAGNKDGATYIQSNYLVSSSGGENINATVTLLSGQTGNLLKISKYKVANIPDTVKQKGKYKEFDVPADPGISLPFSFLNTNTYIIPVIVTSITAGATLTITGGNGLSITKSGTYYLTIDKTAVNELSFKMDKDSAHILVGKIYQQSGFSSQVIASGKEDDLKKLMTTENGYFKEKFAEYDVTYQVSYLDSIPVDNPLSPESFFEENNMFTRSTIPQLNTESIDITVADSSVI